MRFLVHTCVALATPSLFLCFGQKHLTTTVCATAWAGVMRKAWAFALGAGYDLRYLQLMVRTTLSLTGMRNALFW
jgi:hypothetical protein